MDWRGRLCVKGHGGGKFHGTAFEDRGEEVSDDGAKGHEGNFTGRGVRILGLDGLHGVPIGDAHGLPGPRAFVDDVALGIDDDDRRFDHLIWPRDVPFLMGHRKNIPGPGKY